MFPAKKMSNIVKTVSFKHGATPFIKIVAMLFFVCHPQTSLISCTISCLAGWFPDSVAVLVLLQSLILGLSSPKKDMPLRTCHSD